MDLILTYAHSQFKIIISSWFDGCGEIKRSWGNSTVYHSSCQSILVSLVLLSSAEGFMCLFSLCSWCCLESSFSFSDSIYGSFFLPSPLLLDHFNLLTHPTLCPALSFSKTRNSITTKIEETKKSNKHRVYLCLATTLVYRTMIYCSYTQWEEEKAHFIFPSRYQFQNQNF